MKDKKTFMKELWDKTAKELVQMRKKMRAELYSMKMKNAINWLKQTHQLKQIRRNISRVSTVLTHKIKESYGDNRG